MGTTNCIIQPASLGDILILWGALGDKAIAEQSRHTLNPFEHVVWPVWDRYRVSIEGHLEADHVTWVWLPAQNRDHAVLEAYHHMHENGHGHILVTDLSAGFPTSRVPESEMNVTGMSFDVYKYRKLGLPISVKYNGRKIIKRDLAKEASLACAVLSERQLKYGYHVVHCEKGNGGKWIAPTAIMTSAVEVKPMVGYSIIDWCGVIENSQHYYGVDGAVTNMVDIMGLKVGKRTFHPRTEDYRNWRTLARLTPCLREDWQTI